MSGIGVLSVNESHCADSQSYPTLGEYQLGLGSWAIFLYTFSGIAAIILSSEFCLSAWQFEKSVSKNLLFDTLFVNSVYFVVSLLTLSSIVLPKASSFSWALYKIYLGLAMVKFTAIILKLYNDDPKHFVHTITTNSRNITVESKSQEPEDEFINMRSPPCCFCLFCPTNVRLTSGKMELIRLAIYQMPYVQALCMYLVISLNLSGYLQYDDESKNPGVVYFQIIETISFVIALWGIFLFLSITNKYQMGNNKHFRKKALLFRLLLVLINVQGVVIDILAALNIIRCNENMSRIAMAAMIKDSCAVFEVFILGNLNFLLNMVDFPFEILESWSKGVHQVLYDKEAAK
ncbi:hypothetical protein TCAL_16799 [Tigriopus californicus]|uniref:Uncharacterized protein n=1 Tax=Tigriopus californicus TaxID=6832 RepID=A0A553PCN0_TIGCA|nr:organic solute transporter alpha-like protein [Tigriopus californicus]TRY75418.1 hypothetical protein TCAL_16799 [Tigriopus californicus]